MSSSREIRSYALGLTVMILSGGVEAGSFGDAVTPKASYTGEAAADVNGGLHEGAAYAGQFFFGGDLDLQRWVQWDSASVHLYFAARQGDNLSNDEIGNSTSVQEIYGGQGERLANFTLEQKLFHGRLDLEAGRTVANIHFLGSDLCSYFQGNSACGNPTFVFRTSNFTWWPVSSWGGHAKAWLTDKIYLHVGSYEYNPKQAENGQHGLDWSTQGATGAVTPFALGYKSTPLNARLPAMYEVGGLYDSSTYQDPLFDANRVPAAISGQPYATHNSRSEMFVRIEQQVTRPDAAGQRGLTIFATAMRRASGEQIEDHFLEAGFVQKGTFDSRPLDDLAYVVTQQHYSTEALQNLQLARAAAGGAGRPYSSQIMMELSYGIQVTPALRVAPNVHYVIHPDQFGEPGRTYNLPNALVLGMRVDIGLTPVLQTLGRQLGLASRP